MSQITNANPQYTVETTYNLPVYCLTRLRLVATRGWLKLGIRAIRGNGAVRNMLVLKHLVISRYKELYTDTSGLVLVFYSIEMQCNILYLSPISFPLTLSSTS